MHVAWKFLDKRSAAVEAIRAYKDMAFIIENTAENIREQAVLMLSLPATRLTGLPPSPPDPTRGEQRLAVRIDEIDVSLERYRQALEYTEWFAPAWNALADTERTILAEFYMSETLRSGAAKKLEGLLNFSHSHIDRLRSKALSRFAQLLYGV
jgi:hypothetical protein